MDDIIATGSTAAAASPGFATQDEVVDLSGDMGKSADAATARVQESIEHCLADAQARAVLREEKTEAR